MSGDHPDLLALLEGRLDPEQEAAARRHLARCDACRKEESQLRSDLHTLDAALRGVRAGFPDPASLEVALLEVLEPEEETDPALRPEELAPELPPRLRRRLRETDPGEGLAARLRRSLETVAGLGREAAREMAERILAGEGMGAAAPAIREDAAAVDHEPSPSAEPREDQEE